MNTFKIKKDSLDPVIQVTLKDSDGAVDLNGVTAVILKIKKRRAAGSLIELTGELVQTGSGSTAVNKGVVKYVWSGTDTNTIGIYDAEWEVTHAGGDTEVFPKNRYDRIEIFPDLS